MLIKCPECDLQVSDNAFSCPHCGYPMKPTAPRRRQSTKRKRLPNGFGQISEIRGSNLRNPFRVMITVGKTDTGHPISKLLKPVSYFKTYNEAYEALINYHKNPSSLPETVNFSQLYEKWFNECAIEKNDIDQRNIEYVWSYASQLYNKSIKNTTIHDLKICLATSSVYINGELKAAPDYVRAKLKNILNSLYDYALEYNIVQSNLARAFNYKHEKLVEDKEPMHKIFTEEEMNILWANKDKSQAIRMILVQCYSGWRPSELCEMRLENVDLENWSFRGGMKTKAGINRIVPIHSKIKDIVKQAYEESAGVNSEWLFSYATDCGVKQINYNNYQYLSRKLFREIGIDYKHKLHDARKHFITLAKKYHVDDYAIKRIVGHTISDITEKTYTDRSLEWLRDELEKIK